MQIPLPEYITSAPAPPKTPEADEVIFINIAYRPKPQGTAQGGPNGVLLLKENLLGKHYRGFALKYFYEPQDLELPDNLKNWIRNSSIGTISKKLIEAHYYVQHILFKELKKTHGDKIIHLLCHDIGSAAGANLAGLPYTLIYHQQGAFIHERKSFGENLSPTEEHLINTFEKIAFEGAEDIYFPSNGAKDAFLQTTTLDSPQKLRYGSFPLYNSVVDFPISTNAVEFFFTSMGYGHLLDQSKRNNYVIYITIGDYTPNKGIDRCPKLLASLAKTTSKKILWIVLGSKHKSKIHENLVKEKPTFPFECILVPNRQAHELTMGLIKFSDWFLMLQRYSIFDFSTLEAFKLGKAVILSPIGGNLEFNVCNNVLFYDPQTEESNQVKLIEKASVEEYGLKNKAAFSNTFSPAQFKQQYIKIYNKFIDKSLPAAIPFGFDEKNAARIKKLLKGKQVIICGPGSSLKQLSLNDYEGKMLIALNSALLHEIPFAIHIMQDEPSDPTFWDTYIDKKNIVRIYGTIQRPASKNLSINFKYLEEQNIEFNRYYLSQTVFDADHDILEFDLSQSLVHDLKGVLFSALQIATWAETASIELAGIDFSATNFNDAINPNIYNNQTLDNLKIITPLIQKKLPFKALHSDSADVKNIINKESLPTDQNSINIGKKQSTLGILKTLNKKGLYAQTIEEFRQNHIPAYYTNPYYMLILAHAYNAIGDRYHALRCLQSYKAFGGDVEKHDRLFRKIRRDSSSIKSYLHVLISKYINAIKSRT